MTTSTAAPGTPDPAALHARIRDSFDRSGLMRHLGARLGDVAPGRVHIHLPYGPDLTQHLGYFHAGATTSIADTAGGFAARSLAYEMTAALYPGEAVNVGYLKAALTAESFS